MNPMQGLARRLGSAPWFTAMGKKIVKVDLALQRRTNARFGLMTLGGMAGLLLTTTGRRSGVPRTVPLMYVRIPEGYVVVGSNWGGPEHPAWSGNLLAEPRAVVAVRGSVFPVVGRLVEGEERGRLWSLAVSRWPAYSDYLARSGRSIRVFVLTPS